MMTVFPTTCTQPVDDEGWTMLALALFSGSHSYMEIEKYFHTPESLYIPDPLHHLPTIPPRGV